VEYDVIKASFGAITGIVLLLAMSVVAQPIGLSYATAATQDAEQKMKQTQQLTTQHLTLDDRTVDGQTYSLRWTAPIWIDSGAVNVLIADCAPGEFAISEMHIFGSDKIHELESYPVGLPDNSMIWLMVVQNTADVKILASLGVICASDSGFGESTKLINDDSYDRTVNNVLKKFIRVQNNQIVNLNQIINIYQNITQIAVQIAINNTGNVSQSINQSASQIIESNGTNFNNIIPGTNATERSGANFGLPSNTNRTLATMQEEEQQQQQGAGAENNNTSNAQVVGEENLPSSEEEQQGPGSTTGETAGETTGGGGDNGDTSDEGAGSQSDTGGDTSSQDTGTTAEGADSGGDTGTDESGGDSNQQDSGDGGDSTTTTNEPAT
jgi:hypothetical protein